MKKSIFLTVMCMAFSLCLAQQNAASKPETKGKQAEPKETVAFDKVEHDFGTIQESGGTVEYAFSFKNAGKTPLVITKVSASCGCTATDYTKEPVAPGKKGFVKATFDPRGVKSAFTKNVTVFTDGEPQRIVLTIKGDVK